MKLTFDYYHNIERVDVYLCNPDGRELFSLPAEEKNLTLRFNDLSELTFKVNATIGLLDGGTEMVDAYDYIQTKRLVYVSNIGWFQISKVEEFDDGVSRYKTVSTESLQSVFKHKGFYSEERVYCFYNEGDPYDNGYDANDESAIPSVMGQWNKQLGINYALDQGLSEPDKPYEDWTVTYISDNLKYTGTSGVCRNFKETTSYGYDWIVNDVEKAFGVVVLFDFMYKTIHVMYPDEVTERINVVYSFNNFMKDININEDSEDIVTVLNCNGDNCNIASVNPTGANYICDFSYYMDEINHRWMSDELIAKIKSWKAECEDKKEEYETYMSELYDKYKNVTEVKTQLQEASLFLEDLRTAQNKRPASSDADMVGEMCGIVSPERVDSKRKIADGEIVAKTGYSISQNSDFNQSRGGFTGTKRIKAYQFSPDYNKATMTWDFSKSGNYKEDTADNIISYNLSDSNSGDRYYYFSDDPTGFSYCMLQSASIVDKDTVESINYCGGFVRYIAYCYPEVKDGKTTYKDKLQDWIDLREELVEGFNNDLYGYPYTLDGNQYDSQGVVIEPTAESLMGEIRTIEGVLNKISSSLNIISYLSDTPRLLRELNCYWIEGEYKNENIAVSEETSSDDAIKLSNELLSAGYIELSKVCQPRLSFSVSSTNATNQYEFREQMRLLELGKVIAVEKEEGVWYYPALLEITINLDNSDDFGLSFANSLRLDDWGYTYADLVSSAASTSRNVSANWQNIMAYSKDRSQFSSIIRDPLDSTKRALFANGVNQEFIVNHNGILGRKKSSDDQSTFEKEQLRMTNNMIVFTDDNWESARAAFGKISYKDSTSGENVSSYGLIGDTIIGRLMMSEKLKIENASNTISLDGTGITITNQDTKEDVFKASTDGNVRITGEIHAKAGGTIAEFDIEETYIANGKTTYNDAKNGVYIGIDGIGLGAGKFYVSKAGFLSATSGDIAGFEITDGAGIRKTISSNSIIINPNKTNTTGAVIAVGAFKTTDTETTIKNAASFFVDGNGHLQARDAQFFGDMTVGGTISSVISNGRITNKNGGYTGIFDHYQLQFQYGSYSPRIYKDTSVYLRFDGAMRFDGTVNFENTLYNKAGGVIATSDKNLKNTIATFTDKHDVLFDSLIPSTYKYNNGTSGRTHFGFIAQPTVEAIEAAGLTLQDCALACRFEQDNEAWWGLRYDEFVSLNTWQIQKLKARVTELESKLEEISALIPKN